MNDLYIFQDVCLLREIIENCFELMHKMYCFNPRRCNSDSTLSGCIDIFLSKFIFALPTNSEVVQLFEKTRNLGFSCVNTRLWLNSKIILSNLLQSDSNKLNINESFQAYYRQVTSLKTSYKIQLEGEESNQDQQIIIKILKLDKNDQYWWAITKPSATGCIKLEKSVPTWKKFNIMFKTVDLDDKIVHSFITDTNFDAARADAKTLMHSKLYTPIFEKDKVLDSSERSVLQLSETMRTGRNDEVLSYKHNKKLTLPCWKKIIPLCLKHLSFLVKRAGW